MSVRSFCRWVGSALGVLLFAALATPVLANSCGFGCAATFLPPTAPSAFAGCTQNSDCAANCSATCRNLGTSPSASVDRANPSTCNTATRTCSACTCTPNVVTECTGDVVTPVCTNACNTTCAAYNEHLPYGVASIACPDVHSISAPICRTPAPGAAPAGTTGGYCQYACTFGPTRSIRTSTSCTIGSASACATTAMATACTDVHLEYANRATCEAGSGGPKCVAVCNRPTAVADADQGPCNTSAGATTAGADQCLNRCQSVCGQRGMVCNTDSASRCTTAGRCNFSCALAPDSVLQSDRGTSCSYTDSASQGAANQLCSSRCAAYCSEHGGGSCAGTPAATCYTRENLPAGPDTTGSSSDPSQPTTPRQPARTAPRFSVTFPDPFEGSLSVPQVIGNIIRILVGLTGVFFLAVFIYGGLMYLTSAGDPKAVQKGQGAIVNAVIGLVVVLFSFVAVSLIVQVSDQLQTGTITADQSGNAQDESGAIQPGGTTRATGRSSQGSDAPADPQTSVTGSPAAACRTYFGADPATCGLGGGGCPAGATDLPSLLSIWGRSFPAASPEVPDPAGACRTCLEGGIASLQARYPGLATSCVPALVNLWSTGCRTTCNPQAIAALGEQGTTGADICNSANYNTTNASCSRCLTYWQAENHVATIGGVGCPDTLGKAAVWCSGAEAPGQTRRPESGGYCQFTTPRR